jgi:hypothetical protein
VDALVASLVSVFVLVWCGGGWTDGAGDATGESVDTHYGVMFFQRVE